MKGKPSKLIDSFWWQKNLRKWGIENIVDNRLHVGWIWYSRNQKKKTLEKHDLKSQSTFSENCLHILEINTLRTSADHLIAIAHGLVRSRLDFCNALYVGLPMETSWKLQLVQNSSTHGDGNLYIWSCDSRFACGTLATDCFMCPI